MSFLGNLFGKQRSEPVGQFITAQLNARVQPIDRGEIFEDPLSEGLIKLGMGEVTGGGTMLADPPAGIAYVDLEIRVNDIGEGTLCQIAAALDKLGAPKGSKLIVEATGEEFAFGTYEGLGLFLNGTDLPKEVYETSDVNHVVEECLRLIGSDAYVGYWEGPEETALYFYAAGFDDMKAAIAEFVADYPLCRKARIEQIA